MMPQHFRQKVQLTHPNIAIPTDIYDMHNMMIIMMMGLSLQTRFNNNNNNGA